MSNRVLAIDLGATSGRVIEGFVDPHSLRYEVLHRFPNGPTPGGGSLRWDATGLFANILQGMAMVDSRADVVSVGVDSWAVDYALLAKGSLLGEPFHYRDERTVAGVEAVHATVPFEDLFRRNGLQFLTFNTLYQLAAENWSDTAGLADSLLLIPDLVNYWLTGQAFMEMTNASTTGLIGIADGAVDVELVELTGASRSLFAPLVEAGHVVGPFTPEVANRVGFSSTVVAVGSHDTASAVVAAPMSGPSSAYISCGTWGLVGVEVGRPIVSDAAREANFTNERGVDGRIRFLHNVMGLWLLNESVAWWNRGGDTRTLSEFLAQAQDYSGVRQVFDVNDPVFMAPGDIPRRIAAWCHDHGQPPLEDPVVAVAAIVESLAVAFATTVHTAGELSKIAITEISIVGGGSQNTLLCQRLADHAGVPVVAGPVEATALGNILVQARAAGLITGDLDSLRSLVRRTSALVTYLPGITRRR